MRLLTGRCKLRFILTLTLERLCSPAAGRAGPGGARRSRGPASGRKPASSQVRDGTICLSDE